MRLRLVATALVAMAVALSLTACQPAGEPGTTRATSSADATPGPRPRVPEQAFPRDLASLQDHAGEVARTWQDDPRLIEVVVRLGAEQAWQQARAVYLAGDADRLLVVRFTPQETTQQRPTLATLGLPAVPAEGVAQIPPLPASTAEPAELVEAAGDILARCGIERVDVVTYVTGAPAGWRGDGWAREPGWQVLLAQEEQGRPVRVAAVTVEGLPAEPVPCAEAVAVGAPPPVT